MENKIEKLSELVELLKTGVITKDEFEELKKEILNQNSSPQKHCAGTLTISFDGQWLLLDATTKLFINDVLHSTHSTKEGFKVVIPIASSKVFVKTMIVSSAATIYDLVGLDESKNYHLKLTYSAAWGRYSDKINLTEEGVSPDEQVTVKSNSNKHPVKVYVYAFIIMFLFLGISLVFKNMKSSEGSSTSTSESSSSSSNSSSSTNSSSSSSSKNTRIVYSGGYPVEIDLTPPEGYEVGGTCSSYGDGGCDDGGVVNYNGTDMICPSCSGKGFRWHKK